MDFSFGFGLGSSAYLLSGYNPLINYDWSTTTAKEYKTDGVELVINGGFDTDMYWTKGTGWTIVNGVAIRTGVTSNSFVGQTITLTAGTTYKFTLDVNSIVGSGSIYTPSTAQTVLTFSTIGTKTAYFTPNATQPYIIGYYGTGTAELEIDNISIQKVIEEPNKRYLKDVGSTPTYNASMYFGRGAYFNGVDQTITVPINTTIQTALKRVNGVITINETSQTLTNYVISGVGAHKDYYLFTRLLTTAEKDSYTNTPELFYAMAQADSTCMLNMPMCETDGYVRNMKSYSKGTNLTTNGTFDTLTGWSLNTNALAGVTNTNNTLNYSNAHGDYAETKQLNKAIVGMYYLVVFDVVSKIDSPTNVYFQFGRTLLPATGLISSITIGTKIAVVQATHTDGFSISVMTDGIIAIDNVKTYQLTGVYTITNYTSSVRDNAKNLQYGLQTCKFVRDSLGVIQSASDYLECDGVGYSRIEWYPTIAETFTIEMILELSEPGEFQFHGSTYSGGILIGQNNGGNPIYVRVFNSAKYLLSTGDKPYISVTYNSVTKSIGAYINGVFNGVGTATASATSIPFLLGRGYPSAYYCRNPLRLFKVHNKVLTQKEVTENYNSYVAKGLLS